MMCVRCYLEGQPIPRRQIDKNPPFAFMVYEGESRCTKHMPTPATPLNAAQEPPSFIPEEFGTFTPEVEQIETDSRFVVVEDEPVTKPKPKRNSPQQRKRTKS